MCFWNVSVIGYKNAGYRKETDRESAVAVDFTGWMTRDHNVKHVDLFRYKWLGQASELTIWRPLLPYGYCYKAYCVRPG